MLKFLSKIICQFINWRCWLLVLPRVIYLTNNFKNRESNWWNCDQYIEDILNINNDRFEILPALRLSKIGNHSEARHRAGNIKKDYMRRHERILLRYWNRVSRWVTPTLFRRLVSSRTAFSRLNGTVTSLYTPVFVYTQYIRHIQFFAGLRQYTYAYVN